MSTLVRRDMGPHVMLMRLTTALMFGKVSNSYLETLYIVNAIKVLT